MSQATSHVVSTDDVIRELEDLSQRALPGMLVAGHILAWAWFGHVLSQE